MDPEVAVPSSKLDAFLQLHDLSQYAKLFREHDVDYEGLGDLKEEQLTKLGLPVGAINRLLRALRKEERLSDASTTASSVHEELTNSEKFQLEKMKIEQETERRRIELDKQRQHELAMAATSKATVVQGHQMGHQMGHQSHVAEGCAGQSAKTSEKDKHKEFFQMPKETFDVLRLCTIKLFKMVARAVKQINPRLEGDFTKLQERLSDDARDEGAIARRILELEEFVRKRMVTCLHPQWASEGFMDFRSTLERCRLPKSKDDVLELMGFKDILKSLYAAFTEDFLEHTGLHERFSPDYGLLEALIGQLGTTVTTLVDFQAFIEQRRQLQMQIQFAARVPQPKRAHRLKLIWKWLTAGTTEEEHRYEISVFVTRGDWEEAEEFYITYSETLRFMQSLEGNGHASPFTFTLDGAGTFQTPDGFPFPCKGLKPHGRNKMERAQALVDYLQGLSLQGRLAPKLEHSQRLGVIQAWSVFLAEVAYEPVIFSEGF